MWDDYEATQTLFRRIQRQTRGGRNLAGPVQWLVRSPRKQRYLQASIGPRPLEFGQICGRNKCSPSWNASKSVEECEVHSGADNGHRPRWCGCRQAVFQIPVGIAKFYSFTLFWSRHGLGRKDDLLGHVQRTASRKRCRVWGSLLIPWASMRVPSHGQPREKLIRDQCVTGIRDDKLRADLLRHKKDDGARRSRCRSNCTWPFGWVSRWSYLNARLRVQ